eukprot:s1653_g8.t1
MRIIHFAIFAPSCTPELVEIELDFPASEEEALEILSFARDSRDALRFPYVVPAAPQPHFSFGSFLALPEWAQDRVVVLVDTRAVDNRLFALATDAWLQWGSFCLQAGLADDARLDIYIKEAQVVRGRPLILEQGDLVAVLPRGTIPPQRPALTHMLCRSGLWASSPPPLDVSGCNAFLVLTDGLPRLLQVDRSIIHNSEDFRQAASLALGCSLDALSCKVHSPTLESLGVPPPSLEVHSPTLESLGVPPPSLEVNGRVCVLMVLRVAVRFPATVDEVIDVTWIARDPLAGGRFPRFPATVDEVIDVTWIARDPLAGGRFPFLVPTVPQPLRGVMTFIAAPAWLDTHITVCIDATRLDGRFFALRVPAYVSQMRLRHLISLPDRAPFCLYVGTSDTPLAFEAHVHLAEGEVITVHPDLAPVDHRPQLAEQLLRLDDWPEPVALPTGPPGPAYCLVEGTTATLFQADMSQPTHYRHHIAAVYGVPAQELTLFQADMSQPTHYRHHIAAVYGVPAQELFMHPARPRPGDVELDGYPCRTVISICAPGTVGETMNGILIDCRS